MGALLYKFYSSKASRVYDFLLEETNDPLLKDLEGKPLSIAVKPLRPSRTRPQEDYYRGCIRLYLDHIGESQNEATMKMYHDMVLCEAFGSKTIEILGKKKQVPLKRSADSESPSEFSEKIIETFARMALEYGDWVMPEPERV